MINERDIFDEKTEVKKAQFSCPNCRERNEYDVRWLKRTKKKNPPPHLKDNQQFKNSRDYMVRVDDQLMCKNMRCRRRFDIPSSQTVVFI